MDRAAALGFLAGTGFAIAAVAYRGAALSLSDGDAVTRASMTLATTLTLQTVLMGLYIKRLEPGQVATVWRHRRQGWWVGLMGATASMGWFTAMTLVSAALVRAVGQVELLLAFATSVWFLGEKVTAREMVGAALIVGGILLLI